MNTLNPSIKHHLVVGAFLSVWGFLFAFFARPFEHGNMDLQIWINVSVGFSLIIFLSYGVVSWFQNTIYQKLLRWNTVFEISTYFLFYLLYTVATYLYYKTPLVKGIYDFSEFLIKIIVNIFLILTPLLFLARRYTIKLIPIKEDDIIIKGENKLDILKIKKSDLICISNSQNYVEVFFLEKDQLKTKLIRSSLKKIQYDFDFLIQVHRSHLINPSHFKFWKDSSTIALTQIELPVSKNYKNRVIDL
ncbi:LytTR family DNA-binding domain-containing protein [Aquimarina sp. 2201CG5-10]|uniref:LytTR family DNA-binding domain-containing protein n=1 Tax=Aquimarina callyspongiae TaxID=3098150 RepID=UPI002AB544AE|nr:LytTR family DNA-binding domain-containing protein [Aquimarina sp. 2201CG5-10]MDY8135566.1 LytTR family DNA-binding domain-containing protein [Aquimarina sp. 2201CG5-10]